MYPIKVIRKKKKLTLSDVAIASGITPGTLSRIENGKCNASLKTAERLSSVLGLSVEKVLYPERFIEQQAA